MNVCSASQKKNIFLTISYYMLQSKPLWKRSFLSQGSQIKVGLGGFPGGTVVKKLPANAGDTGSSPGPGRSHMPRSN